MRDMTRSLTDATLPADDDLAKNDFVWRMYVAVCCSCSVLQCNTHSLPNASVPLHDEDQ